MTNNINIVSLKDFPDYRGPLIEYVKINWETVSVPFIKVVEEVFREFKPFPKCYLMLKNGKIIGFYQLVARELVDRKDLTPWITCVFIDERERGHHLSSKLLKHGRKVAGKMGYPKVYLTTDHIRLYEKFGFKEIGLGKFISGRPTKIYEHSSIRL